MSVPSVEDGIAGGRLTIDLSALRANYRTLLARARSGECGAVVKANAYGLGVEAVVTTLLSEGCRTFFVARASEGIAVRHLAPEARIYVFDGVHADTVQIMQNNGLEPVLGSEQQRALWAEAGQGAPCAVHVDTGMNRLGFRPDEFERAVGNGALNQLQVSLLMTHPACADQPDHPMNGVQRERFASARALMPGVPASYCNSAALLGEGPTLDLSRPGIALYGGEAIDGVPALEPVVTLEARIVQTREVHEGEAVGYGATWIADRRSVLAVCAIGYADGYPRAIGTGVPLRETSRHSGWAALGGYLVDIVGRVSMDLTIFDVTDVPDDIRRAHDHIELIGETVPLDAAAIKAGTIGYELLTSLGSRYARIAIGA